MRRDDERLIDMRDAAQAALRFAKGRSAKDVANDEPVRVPRVRDHPAPGNASTE
jgi:hypothetical protein